MVINISLLVYDLNKKTLLTQMPRNNIRRVVLAIYVRLLDTTGESYIKCIV